MSKIQQISVAISVLVGIASIFSFLLELPETLVSFEKNKKTASNTIFNLIWKTDSWNGVFDSFPEGVVNMEDLNLSSDSDIRLELTTYDGRLFDGTIESDDLCQLPSPYRRKLLKGEVHILGRSATLTVFEFIAGREVDFFSFKVQLEGGLLEVLHSESSLVPEGTRLFYNHYPWKLLGEVPPKDEPLNDLGPDICKEFRDRLMNSTPSAVPQEVPTPSANSH